MTVLNDMAQYKHFSLDFAFQKKKKCVLLFYIKLYAFSLNFYDFKTFSEHVF